MRPSTKIDWTVRKNVRAHLRVLMKRNLRKYSYPAHPSHTDRAATPRISQSRGPSITDAGSVFSRLSQGPPQIATHAATGFSVKCPRLRLFAQVDCSGPTAFLDPGAFSATNSAKTPSTRTPIGNSVKQAGGGLHSGPEIFLEYVISCGFNASCARFGRLLFSWAVCCKICLPTAASGCWGRASRDSELPRAAYALLVNAALQSLRLRRLGEELA